TVDGRWRCINVRERVAVRRAARREDRFARVPTVVIRREHRGMAQWEDGLGDCFIGLYRPGVLPSCVEPPPQHVALPFGTLQALGEHVAVVSALFEFGMEAP